MTQDEINAVKKAAEKMRKQESAQDEIIEMARQSGWTDDLLEVSFVSPMLERFAKLVAAKAFQNGYEKGIAAFNEAVWIEREACALICDEHADDPVYCGEAIRARGEA
jgi:flagellar biosynthesis/type III secretory pathway protein FliH